MTWPCERCVRDSRRLVHPDWQCRIVLEPCPHFAVNCTEARGHEGAHTFTEHTCTQCGSSTSGAQS